MAEVYCQIDFAATSYAYTGLNRCGYTNSTE